MHLDDRTIQLRGAHRQAVHAGRGGRPFLDLTIAADAQAPARARRAAGAALHGWDRQRRERALLVISELVTNAVLHGSRAEQDQVSLRVARRGATTRIEVTDPATGGGGEIHSGELGLEGSRSGWGLPIVAELTDRWGIERGPARTLVWCELDGQ
jgi:anti-sigma regulatory factor (Ser/Thr protein kinase)